MDRDEVISMALDIYHDYDVSMEEAMDIAMENQMSKLRRTDPGAYAERKGMKDYGAKAAAQSAYNLHNKRPSNRYNKALDIQLSARRELAALNDIPERYKGEHELPSFKRYTAPAEKKDRYVSDHFQRVGQHAKDVDDMSRINHRIERTGSYAKYAKGPYTKQSKESAILETALDLMDQYNVTREEALDLATEYLYDYE
jgi:hypothetical protein